MTVGCHTAAVRGAGPRKAHARWLRHVLLTRWSSLCVCVCHIAHPAFVSASWHCHVAVSITAPTHACLTLPFKPPTHIGLRVSTASTHRMNEQARRALKPPMFLILLFLFHLHVRTTHAHRPPNRHYTPPHSQLITSAAPRPRPCFRPQLQFVECLGAELEAEVAVEVGLLPRCTPTAHTHAPTRTQVI